MEIYIQGEIKGKGKGKYGDNFKRWYFPSINSLKKQLIVYMQHYWTIHLKPDKMISFICVFYHNKKKKNNYLIKNYNVVLWGL